MLSRQTKSEGGSQGHQATFSEPKSKSHFGTEHSQFEGSSDGTPAAARARSRADCGLGAPVSSSGEARVRPTNVSTRIPRHDRETLRQASRPRSGSETPAPYPGGFRGCRSHEEAAPRGATPCDLNDAQPREPLRVSTNFFTSAVARLFAAARGTRTKAEEERERRKRERERERVRVLLVGNFDSEQRLHQRLPLSTTRKPRCLLTKRWPPS